MRTRSDRRISGLQMRIVACLLATMWLAVPEALAPGLGGAHAQDVRSVYDPT